MFEAVEEVDHESDEEPDEEPDPGGEGELHHQVDVDEHGGRGHQRHARHLEGQLLLQRYAILTLILLVSHPHWRKYLLRIFAKQRFISC